jgi:hypothetical protein
MARDNSPQRFEEVDGPPTAQRHQTGDRVFTGRGCQLRTGGISMGSLRPRHVFPRALASPSVPRVEQAEERVLVRAAAVDVEGWANVLLHQLDDADRRGVGEFFFPSPSIARCSFLIVSEILCVCQR